MMNIVTYLSDTVVALLKRAEVRRRGEVGA
jgi:hypothetical protein